MILQSMIRAAFGQGSISLFITANTTNVNLFSLVTPTPTAPVNVNVTVNAGVTIGATGSNYALDIGAFPSGSKVTLDVYGSIQGVGGAANGGVGGSCIYADRAGVQVTINLKSGGTIYAGGGGGGKGGNGGTGGTGGQGYYVATNYQYNGSSYLWRYTQNVSAINGDIMSDSWQAVWNNSTIGSGAGAGPSTYGAYHKGSLQMSNGPLDDGSGNWLYNWYYSIGQDYNVYTSGGAGGGGGAGGDGGRGQGYDGANAAGVSGGSGSAGAAGGTNAGQGGTGGVGGSGGSGGTWGNSGNTGATGVGGGTGASGNYTAGSAGSAGAGGSSGGLAGYYLYKGTNSANVTFTNAGTVAGRLG